MKTQLILLFMMATIYSSNAGTSTIKAGGNFNADITEHKLGKLTYPSWEVAYERSLGKKFSINATFNYAKRHYEYSSLEFFYRVYEDIDQSLSIEGRYYLKSNNEGLFFQVGIPFTYTTEKNYREDPAGDLYYEVYDYAISAAGGLGMKFNFTPRLGLEMSMIVSPSLNFLGVDYGTSGFIKSGIKLCYAFL